MERQSLIDDDGNYVGPTSSDPDALRRAARLIRDAQRTTRQPDVQLGANRHHREFDQLNMARIFYAANLVKRDEVARAYRDELGGRVDYIRMMHDYVALTGVTPPSYEDKNALMRTALGQSDFPYMIGTALNRALIDGFNSAPESWSKWTKYLPVPDFKATPVRLGASMPAPDEVEELGEVPFASLYDDGAQDATIGNYLQRISYSRQALLSSDLSLMVTSAQAGIAVSRAIGNAVFSLLTTNAALDDGTALFHADHGNLDASGASPSVSELDTAFSLMGAQQNAAGEYLNYKARFVIGGPGYANTLAALRSASNEGNTDGESDGNIVTLIDSRLSGSTKWFTSADPVHGGILIAVLEGTEGQPRFEQLTNPPSTASDGLHFRLGYAFRAVCGNYKALTYNAGA